MIRLRLTNALLLAATAVLLVLFASAGPSAAMTSVRLSWDANSEPDLEGYILQYGTAPGVHTVRIDVGNVTSHNLYDLPAGTTHYFTAVAYDLTGNESEESNEIAVVPGFVSPSLHISTSAAPNPVPAGALLTYTFNYSNSGPDDANGVAIRATIPVHTTFASTSHWGARSGSTVTWLVGKLNAGTSGSVQLTVQVESPLPDGTMIFNSGYTIDSYETNPVSGAAVQTTVTSAPILQVSKTHIPDMVEAGDAMTYRITYSNVGNATATGVVLIDRLPQNTSYVWASAGGSLQSGAGHWLTWYRDSLPPGASGTVHEIVRVSSALPFGSLISSTGLLIASNETAAVYGEDNVAGIFSSTPPTISSATDEVTGSNSVVAGGLHNIRIIGNLFHQGAKVRFGPDIVVVTTTWVSLNRLDVSIAVDPAASRGPRRLTVTNPNLVTTALDGALNVQYSPDLNPDCLLDGSDFTLISRALDSTYGEPLFLDAADLDGNGSVDPLDLDFFLTYLGRPLPTCP